MFKYFIALLCSLAVFVGAGSYFSQSIIESKHQLIFQGFFPQDSHLTVFSEKYDGQRTVIETLPITGKSPHVDQRFIIDLQGKPMDRLGLEFVARQPVGPAEAIHLHFIHIVNSFTEDLRFNHSEIQPNFVSEQFALGEVNRLDYRESDNTISLISKKLVCPPNILFSTVLPLILGILTFLVLLKSNVTDLPAYQDMGSGPRIKGPSEFDVINGIRGLSALLVLFSHTAPGFASLKMGLALLFVLSGFLLAKPFVLTSRKIFNAQTIYGYLVKRSKRILPMYYFTVFILYLVSFEFDAAARHFLFIEARGHLWAIPQILSFYMILPGILIITSISYRLHRILPVLLLALSIFAWKHYAPFPNLFYNGSYHTPFMLDSFLLGVAASYVQYGLIHPSARMQSIIKSRSLWFSMVAIVVTTLSIAWSAPVEPPDTIAHLMQRFDVKCLLAASIILLAVNSPQTMFAKLIGNPMFRSLGIIGFSFYLLHGLGIQLVLQFQQEILGHEELVYRSWYLALSVLAITYIISLFTYSYIERPFFGKRQKSG